MRTYLTTNIHLAALAASHRVIKGRSDFVQLETKTFFKSDLNKFLPDFAPVPQWSLSYALAKVMSRPLKSLVSNQPQVAVLETYFSYCCYLLGECLNCGLLDTALSLLKVGVQYSPTFLSFLLFKDNFQIPFGPGS